MPATVPESTKTSLHQRLLARARERWPALADVRVRFRGRFAYVDGELERGEVLPLCRLRYAGSATVLGVCHLPRQPGRLRGLGPAQRPAQWNSTGGAGLCLRALSCRPERLVLTTHELTKRTTKSETPLILECHALLYKRLVGYSSPGGCVDVLQTHLAASHCLTVLRTGNDDLPELLRAALLDWLGNNVEAPGTLWPQEVGDVGDAHSKLPTILDCLVGSGSGKGLNDCRVHATMHDAPWLVVVGSDFEPTTYIIPALLLKVRTQEAHERTLPLWFRSGG